MGDSPYERVKGGRLTFKGGDIASRSKSITKKTKKKKKNQIKDELQETAANEGEESGGGASGEAIYTIDAAKKMKYEDLFPVEAKKFGYDPNAKSKSVEEALDERVKKKADRYCK